MLDVILDAFESMIEDAGFFLGLLKCYPADPQTFVHILGNKFHFYQVSCQLWGKLLYHCLQSSICVLYKRILKSFSTLFLPLKP